MTAKTAVRSFQSELALVFVVTIAEMLARRKWCAMPPRRRNTMLLSSKETIYLDNDIYEVSFTVYDEPDVGLDGLYVDSVRAIKGSPEPSESDINQIYKILAEDYGHEG